MSQTPFDTILAGIADGSVVPYLGPGVLQGVRDLDNGEAMPVTSDELIIAMNGGKPMAPKLMYEFPRAAMNIELKRGRSAITRFLDGLYGARRWSRAPIHDWLAGMRPPYVVDVNRDTQLLDSYAETPHLLIQGIARMGGTEFRFHLYQSDGSSYQKVTPDSADTSLPILFKPMGAPRPGSSYIASDADYVDYITELMGGFGVPAFLKEYRKGRRYLFTGLRLTRDTERMVMADIIYDAAEPAGWVLIPEPTDKERRFCERKGLEVIDADTADLLAAAGFAPAGLDAELREEARLAGC